MSKEGDRQSVFRTTKVRTTLKGDSSWIQRCSEPEVEQEQEQEEKPWLAEVRAKRANGVFAEPSPSTSPPASPTSSEGAKASSGYLIRGVFTRANTEKAPSVANGTSATSTTFVKKPTESYKKIAPHILRSGTGSFAQDDDLLSPEEHERRAEAASSVLRSSAVRQRSYVLSAAKKYDAADEPKVIPSFVAKRVVISEDDEPTKTSKEVKPPAPTPQSTAPQPSSKDSKLAVEQKTATATSPVKSSPDVNTFTALSDTLISQKSNTPSSVKTQKPGVALESSPLNPTSSSDTKLAVEQKTKTETSPLKSNLVDVKKVSPAPEPSPTTPASSRDTKLPVEQKTQASPVKTSSVEAAKLNPALDPSLLILTSSKDTKPSVEQKPKTESSPVKPSSVDTRDPCPGLDPNSPDVNTFTALSDTLISQKSNTPSSVKTQKPGVALESSPLNPTSSSDTKLAVEQKTKTETSPLKSNLVDVKKVSPAPEPSPTTPASSRDTKLPVEQKTQASPVKTSSVEAAKLNPALDPSLLILTSSKDTKPSVEQKPKTESSPVKPSSPPDAQPTPDTSEDLDTDDFIAVVDSDSTVDLLDPFPVDTTKRSTKPADPVPVRTFSIKSTIDPAALSESSEDSKPTEISDSTVDLLDPFPVDTTKSSPAPSCPWTSPESEQRMESMEGGALDALADTVIPFNTNTSPGESFPTFDSKAEHLSESPEETTGDPMSGLQNYTITFERKSLKNNSPWSKWTSPTVSDYTETKTYSSSPSTMDRTLETVSQETNSPDYASKKGFVFVKEYVNTSAVSLQNTGLPSDEQLSSDYTYSTSSSYSYSSPSSYSGSMSACTYCGKMVGSENRITIEHLNISCHPACFKCGVCSKPMGDLLYNMFLHKGVVHCESCYSSAI